ncbi:hypothetical protein CAEBREN_26088 [Caenorhabditis brenneri]|uniref:Uncharacterized protein n=1 Tax=Caenorhabditis brenneri TaxID=135651 RepID=G0NZY1_CAEBE|nr:hypothetical protein CAEBREN_26088 [Caenorhabditis brenneri]
MNLHFHQVISQYKRDYSVFTAHLICDLPKNNNFRYRIEYIEEDFFTANDNVTYFNNVGNSINGEAIENNFGVTYGDGFMDKYYEFFALILHNCTRNPKKMRRYRQDFELCSTEKGGCKFSYKVNITDLGRRSFRNKRFRIMSIKLNSPSIFHKVVFYFMEIDVNNYLIKQQNSPMMRQKVEKMR